MRFVKANVIYDCFESITFDDQNSPKLNDNGKAGIGFSKPENSKPRWLKNKLDKDKAKAGRKTFVPNQPWRSSTKVKSGWKKNQPRRDLSSQSMKSQLKISHRKYAQTLTDSSTGKIAPGSDQFHEETGTSNGIQLAVGPQPLRLRNHNFGLTHRIMVKRLATSPHDPLGITDSACKNQLVVVSVKYGPFYTYIPIRSTIIDKSRVARDPIAMHTSWRSNSDIASVTSIGYPRMKASGESSTTMHRLLHASGPHPIPPPNDPKYSISGTFAHSQTSEMASSSFTNTYLVDFESVLNIPDNEGMQNMFKALESSGLRDLKAKEKLMLDWAETDSLETDVKRKVYILAKYREMLLRKFVESHRKYYTPGKPWTGKASKIIDLLSVAHSKSLEDLIAQQKEHGLPVEQPCTSTFLDASVGSGAVLAQFYSMAKSTCWVRPLVLIDGVWTPIQGTDFWRSSCKFSLFVNRKKLPEVVMEENFVPHVFFIEPVQYWGAAPSLIKTWGWARVFIHIIRYSMFGCLRPVREDVCRDIVEHNLGVERIPASFRSIFAQGIYTDSFVGYFSDSDVQSVSDFEESSSDGSTVYRSPSPLRDFQFALGPVIFGIAQEEQLYFVQSPESPPATSPHQESSSSTDVSMHFDSEDISLNARADIQPSLPVDSTAFTAALDDLRMSILQHINDSNSDMFSKLNILERGFRETLRQHEESLKQSIQNVRQDSRKLDDIQTLCLNDFRKHVLAQNASVFTVLADVRKEVQEINSKVDIMATKLEIVKKDVEATKEAISHQLLEFQTQAQANHIVLTDQLGQLVDYINRGGNAKKGEGESSRGPQPPPAVQIRDNSISGGNIVRTIELTQADIDAANRQILERMMREDREREREKRSYRVDLIRVLRLLGYRISMPPRRARDQQDDDAPPPPPPPPQLTPYERTSVDMLVGVTRLLERQSERSGKLHEEDVAERFRKQGPKEFSVRVDAQLANLWRVGFH
ncbi:golgin candidate 5 [Dorcoceras hygrometricum]|uniref:Golgin candidate 5 n=1 Tax=Dorcoceras hygrometricum TaxID=472368 RepID=A0A2Z7AAJ0_9LAMI|nr:golgin candidate 5 [Dorcoceras hygrometricum]